MNTRKLILSAMICTGLVLSTGIASAQCVPGFQTAFNSNPVYAQLRGILQPQAGALGNLLSQVDDQASYQTLLTRSRNIAGTIANGRVVITVPDGTVVLDTSKTDDPNNNLPQGNSYQHFQDKTVNENHNSRVAIFTAQEYPCGQGIETKLSTSTNETETYFAIRLGAHLNNQGTARLSVKVAN